MFLKYGGRNFYCFKEDFDIDLRLNKNCPNEISHGRDVSSALCIKGANAAGKTNALKALSFMKEFITNSFELKPEAKIPADTFFNNDQNIYLFCEFRSAESEKRYEVTFNGNEVKEESLTLLGSGQTNTTLFTRKGNELVCVHESFDDLKSIPNIRNNASVISIANQHEIPCISDIYSLFYNTLSNVSKTGFRNFSEKEIHELYFRFPDILHFTEGLLKKFDTGIEGLTIESQLNEEGEEVFYPVFTHKIEEGTKTLRFMHQSSGTQRLYVLLAYCYVPLTQEESSCLIADELDLHLHSVVLQEVIKLFEKDDTTQLIFSCQNDLIMDQMGKYRTILINKEESESYSFRLDELPSDLLRNGRPITPHYHASKIGGVPNIGE